MADIPGIIEGASEGKGLGLRFLRHIERNSLLLFMIPADSDDIRKEYEILNNELVKYNPELLDKGRVLAITKSDMLDDELREVGGRAARGRARAVHLVGGYAGYHGTEGSFVERVEQGDIP